MIQINKITDKLLGLVGWEQSYNPENAIDEAMTKSESGLTFQGAHPLCTLDNVRAIMPDDFLFIYPSWEAKEYAAGQKVRHNNKIWVSINTTQTEPMNGNVDWKEYNLLSDYLEKITRDGITKAIQTFTQIKGLEKETKNLLEFKTLFDGAGRLRATINNSNKIVGYEINPERSVGVTTKIERIGLQMTGATGVVRLYLFHTSKIDPVKTFDLDFTVTNGGFQWFNIENCFLPYMGEQTNAGGAWFLCYNQRDLPNGMEAINISKDWSREPCGTCNVGNIETWREITKYLQISPFMVQAPETFEQFPELWDNDNMLYTNTQNYGINVELSVGCDLTDFIISQRSIFQTVVQRQVAAIALRTMAMNPDVKVNRNQSNVSKMDILYELDGNTNGVRPGGLGYDLKKAFEVLELDTRGIDRLCLGCNNKGVKYRTV